MRRDAKQRPPRNEPTQEKPTEDPLPRSAISPTSPPHSEDSADGEEENDRDDENTDPSKRKRRRRKGKGPAGRGGEPTPAEDRSPPQGAESGPQEPRGSRFKPDPERLAKFAWKIYLSEISEEGVALTADSDARELSKRCFRLAEIFLEEESRRR
jgi:hypothetical protein